MAFNVKNLVNLTNGKKGTIPTLYYFYNADNDNVTGDGYIPNDVTIAEGDQIIIISKDYEDKDEGYLTLNNGKLKINLR
ncbi:MAG: hypothetical protein LBC92_00370 [Rickettsiales bacterium]|jgi:hypothetical protein|nr:hypothetical protein [Rickettsiales bacterium]